MVSPRKFAGTAYHSSSRFSVLREQSRSSSRNTRIRSVSQKRPFETENPSEIPPSQAYQNPDPAHGKLTIEIEAEKVDNLKIELVKVASICDKVNKDLEDAPFSKEIKEVLGGILTAVRHLGAIQGNLLPDKPATTQPKPTFAQVSYAGAASGKSYAYQAAKKKKLTSRKRTASRHKGKSSVRRTKNTTNSKTP